MQKSSRILAYLAVFSIVPLSGMSTDIYAPSLPAIKQYFNSTTQLTQLSISIYMLTLGFFQLIAGPLSEHFGRKPNLIVGCFLFIIASYFAANAESMSMFLWMRFFQGIALSLTATSIRTIFPDICTGTEYYKMVNYSTIAWAIGPIASPAVGGYLQTHIGWHANFYALALYTIVALLFAYLMPETISQKTPVKFKKAIQTYISFFNHKVFISCILTVMLVYSVVTIFYIVGPFLIQTQLGYSPLAYGYIALALGSGWFSGNIVNRIFISTDPIQKIRLAVYFNLFITLSMAVVNAVLPLNLCGIVIPTFLLTVTGGIVFPNAFGKCMSLFTTASGYASALTGASLIAGCGLISTIATLLKTQDSQPLSYMYLTIAILLFVIYFIGLRPLLEKTHVDN